MRRTLVLSLFLCGCFPIRPDAPTAGVHPVPRRSLAMQESRQAPPSSVPPVAATSAQTPTTDIRDATPDQLQQAAVERYKNVQSYCARLRRRETKDGKTKPDELVLFKERKEPFAVHMKWIGPEAVGREVLYSQGQHDDKLHIMTATGDIPFTPAGRRMALARNSLFVKAANPNHEITDAGLSHNLRDLSRLIAAAKDANSGYSVRSLGRVKRAESAEELDGIEIKVPSGRDPDLPRGGTRQVFYSPQTKLPVLYLCYDENGREQNYNYYDRIQTDLKLDDDDFNPDKLWGKATPSKNP